MLRHLCGSRELGDWRVKWRNCKIEWLHVITESKKVEISANKYQLCKNITIYVALRLIILDGGKPGFFGFNTNVHRSVLYELYNFAFLGETTTRVLQKTSEFSRDETSTIDYFSLQTTVRSRQYEHNSTFKLLNTEGIQSCFTKDVILILCSCGVGLVFLTLAIVFACKFACKKYISARKNVHISASDVYQQPIH